MHHTLTDLHQPAWAMQDEQHIEDRVSVVGEPEATEEVFPAIVGKAIDNSCLESQQDSSDARNGLPTPVMELGQIMCTARVLNIWG